MEPPILTCLIMGQYVSLNQLRTYGHSNSGNDDNDRLDPPVSSSLRYYYYCHDCLLRKGTAFRDYAFVSKGLER